MYYVLLACDYYSSTRLFFLLENPGDYYFFLVIFLHYSCFIILYILCSIKIFYVHVFRRKIYDEYNDEEVEVTKSETRLIRRLLKGKAPHAEFDPYAVCKFPLISY